MLKQILISQNINYNEDGTIKRDEKRYKLLSDRGCYIRRIGGETLFPRIVCREEEVSKYEETNVLIIK